MLSSGGEHPGELSLELQGGSRLAVLGSPIGHSRSPRIHAAAYSALGKPWHYSAIECGEADLEAKLENMGEEWRGLSLTMPLKEEAHRLAAILDPVAQESGVVNTLFRLAGHAGWAGFNTDVAGLAAALTREGLDASRTVVLGAGATAVSAVLAARSLGAERITIFARRAAAAAELAERFGCDSAELSASTELAGGDEVPTLVISTLPGPAGPLARIPIDLMSVPLFDVAYDPWPSPLALRWREAGGVAHSGLAMLVEQALLQVRIFAGGDPAIALPDEDRVLAAMRAAVDMPT